MGLVTCIDCKSTSVQLYEENKPHKIVNDESLSAYYEPYLDKDIRFKKYKPSKNNPENISSPQINIFNKFNLNNLLKLRLIGVGSYGKVYLVSNKTNNNQLYAVKVLNKKLI